MAQFWHDGRAWLSPGVQGVPTVPAAATASWPQRGSRPAVPTASLLVVVRVCGHVVLWEITQAHTLGLLDPPFTPLL